MIGNLSDNFVKQVAYTRAHQGATAFEPHSNSLHLHRFLLIFLDKFLILCIFLVNAVAVLLHDQMQFVDNQVYASGMVTKKQKK